MIDSEKIYTDVTSEQVGSKSTMDVLDYRNHHQTKFWANMAKR